MAKVTDKLIVEVEGVVTDILSPKNYRVEITHGDYKGRLIPAELSGAIYYDGTVLFKGDKVALDIKTSDPTKGTITYRL